MPPCDERCRVRLAPPQGPPRRWFQGRDSRSQPDDMVDRVKERASPPPAHVWRATHPDGAQPVDRSMGFHGLQRRCNVRAIVRAAPGVDTFQVRTQGRTVPPVTLVDIRTISPESPGTTGSTCSIVGLFRSAEGPSSGPRVNSTRPGPPAGSRTGSRGRGLVHPDHHNRVCAPCAPRTPEDTRRQWSARRAMRTC